MSNMKAYRDAQISLFQSAVSEVVEKQSGNQLLSEGGPAVPVRTTTEDPMLEAVASYAAVSYTHLDVYKRQVHRCLERQAKERGVDFDAIVIGSGFGGAITACRLAQKGQKVLILERGREWDKASYPRAIEDDWIWSHSHPEKYHGWLDLRVFKGMSVALGAGVGGGSLIYANISRVPPVSYTHLDVYKRQW